DAWNKNDPPRFQRLQITHLFAGEARWPAVTTQVSQRRLTLLVCHIRSSSGAIPCVSQQLNRATQGFTAGIGKEGWIARLSGCGGEQLPNTFAEHNAGLRDARIQIQPQQIRHAQADQITAGFQNVARRSGCSGRHVRNSA
ncbi:MAG: hypothetical protein ACKOCH_15160, partial [Bacteroidota bacterium]